MEFAAPKEQIKEERMDVSGKMRTYPYSYYEEMDPAIRLAMLDTAEASDWNDEAQSMRRKLFHMRYGETIGDDPADHYIGLLMEFRFLANSGTFTLLKGQQIKKLRKELAKAGYYEADGASEQVKETLYQEIRHLGRLYISLCQSDKQYGSLLFGIGRMKESSIEEKIAHDMYVVADEVPERFGLSEELRTWTEALHEAFETVYPGRSVTRREATP